MQPTIESVQPTTTVIVQRVKPGREPGYEEWAKGIAAAARQFAGYRSVTLLQPQDSSQPEYVIVLQFDRAEHLQTWMDSPIRQDWIERSQPLIERPATTQVLTGLETWFTLPHRPTQKLPARYKMAILTAISVFTLVNLYSWILSGLISGLPPLLRSLIVIVLVVMSLTYIVMPRLTKLFQRWLFSKY